MGVFSICSPRRPNAIGLSVLELLARDQNVLKVRCIDMIDGTPILDIKPFIPGYDSTDDATIPGWLERARKKR